ncbi:Hypothetical protein FKW44_004765 [Caligus rogercresseyi]|uniref:Uncharacterized protein n=1 Tax=Caligus rogercresseyi TaxID=217165 RepID=A0A7T8HML8_CALRO|nr:Hypothetical protein FKW44_004765 [Caligus rogercresseyi]
MSSFYYGEVIDRQFKLLDELEKRIPRYHPVLWKGEPRSLSPFTGRNWSLVNREASR